MPLRIQDASVFAGNARPNHFHAMLNHLLLSGCWSAEFDAFPLLKPKRPIHNAGGCLTVNCPHCGSPTLRNSRFKAADLVQLLLMRMAVRCRNCQERSFVSVVRALQIRRDSKIRRAEATLRKRTNTST